MASGRELALFHARRAKVPDELMLRLVNQESRWNPQAVSPAGARGLGQAMPDTWRQPGYGVTPGGDINDPNEQLRFTADYAAAMLNNYGGDPVRAMAAYNWGPGNADKWNGDPNSLPAETRDYVQKVAMGQGGMGGDVPMGGNPGFVPPQGGTIAEPPMPPSLLDQPASGNTPVTTLADLDLAQQGNKFHGGMALQSLGAAISAGSQGLSAADALGNIRENYFKEQDASYAKQREEMQRQAAIEMMGGTDSALGQALAQGMPLEQAMAVYGQERGFQQQSAMQSRDIWNQQHMQNAGFGQQYGMAGYEDSLTRGRMGAQHGMDLERDQLGYNQQDRVESMRHGNAVEMAGVNAGYTFEGQRRDQDFSAGQNEQDRAQRREELRVQIEKDRRDYNTEVTRATNRGAAGKQFVARALEAAGDPAGAARIQQMATTAFEDPAMVNSIMDSLKTAENPVNKAQEIIGYVQTEQALRAAGRTAEADGVRDMLLTKGAPSTVVNNNMGGAMKPFIEGEARVLSEKYTARLSDYSTAEGALDSMEYELSQNPNVRTGAVMELLLQPLNVMAGTGLFGDEFREEMGSVKAIDRANFILASASKMPGAVSNYEQQTYKQANIGVGTDQERILNDIKLAKTSFARSRAQAEYISERVQGSAQQEGGDFVSIAKAESEWREMVKQGDPRTHPLIKDLDSFSRENIVALGGVALGDTIKVGGEVFKVDTPEEMAEIASILGTP